MRPIINYNEPIFDPFGERGATHYHPTNSAAIHLVAIQLTYRDIARLQRIYSRSRNRYTKKLICKYVIIELVSIDAHITSLANDVISGKVGYKISDSDLVEIKKVYKEYKAARKPKWSQLQAVRNRLGAHRDSLDLLTVSKLWDQVDTEAINTILRAVAPMLRLLMKLNVYTWSKSHRSGIISFIQPLDPSTIVPIEDNATPNYDSYLKK
ncbi:MAG: hypothetical protein HYR77_01490 [Ignavibacteria bacterium]|nr:hypothetical protein [Ignavibacteria bacterium]